jgi:hypothetical protein
MRSVSRRDEIKSGMQLVNWRDPFLGKEYPDVPVDLARRLDELYVEYSTERRPRGRNVYYEQMHSLLVVAWTARRAREGVRGSWPLDDVICQAFRERCEPRDIALASSLKVGEIEELARSFGC